MLETLDYTIRIGSTPTFLYNNALDCYKSRVLEATRPLGRYVTDCFYFLFYNMLVKPRRGVLQRLGPDPGFLTS